MYSADWHAVSHSFSSWEGSHLPNFHIAPFEILRVLVIIYIKISIYSASRLLRNKKKNKNKCIHVPSRGELPPSITLRVKFEYSALTGTARFGLWETGEKTRGNKLKKRAIVGQTSNKFTHKRNSNDLQASPWRNLNQKLNQKWILQDLFVYLLIYFMKRIDRFL